MRQTEAQGRFLEGVALFALLATAPSVAQADRGEELYERHCLVCHQADGGGVPFMQPPLIGSPRANGSPEEMIAFVLGGSAALRPEDRHYDNDMPPFRTLGDDELAAILTYVRTHFENYGGAIAAEQVAHMRKQR